MIFIFVFENYQNSFSWGPRFGPFWSAKYVNFEDGSCEIRLLSRSIQETYTLKLASTVFCQIFIFSPNDSPSKTVKNVFYFIEKALFVLARRFK